MALKKLKEYEGLDFKGVKAASAALNESELAAPIVVKVGTKGEEMLEAFIKAFDSIPDDKLADVPKAAADFYQNTIPDVVFDDLGAPAAEPEKPVEPVAEPAPETEDAGAPTETATETTPSSTEEAGAPDENEPEEAAPVVESECPTFGTGWNPEEEDCKACTTDFPDEAAACQKAVEAAAKATTKPKTRTAGPSKKSRYGHMVNSMAARIDDLVFKGGKRADIIATIMEEFKRDEPKARVKVNSHIAVLVKDKGIEFTEGEDGTIKAKQEFSKDQTAEMTVSTLK